MEARENTPGPVTGEPVARENTPGPVTGEPVAREPVAREPVAREPVAVIRDPVAVIIVAVPEHEPAYHLMSLFVELLFKPGTPADDQFHAVDTTWNDIDLSIAVFPAEHIPALRSLAEERGLILFEGSPAAGARGPRYDADQVLRRELGIEVGDRTYVLNRSYVLRRVPATYHEAAHAGVLIHARAK